MITFLCFSVGLLIFLLGYSFVKYLSLKDRLAEVKQSNERLVSTAVYYQRSLAILRDSLSMSQVHTEPPFPNLLAMATSLPLAIEGMYPTPLNLPEPEWLVRVPEQTPSQHPTSIVGGPITPMGTPATGGSVPITISIFSGNSPSKKENNELVKASVLGILDEED